MAKDAYLHTVSCDVGHPGKHSVSHVCMVENVSWETVTEKDLGVDLLSPSAQSDAMTKKSWQDFVCVRLGCLGTMVGSGW